VAVSLRQRKRVKEQRFEVVFHLKAFSAGQTRKSWRIQNDSVKFFAFSRQSGQHCAHVVCDEAMIDCWQAVQRKIFAPAGQIFLGKIDV